MKLLSNKILFAVVTSILLAIPAAAQQENNSLSDSGGIKLKLEKSAPSKSGISKTRAKFIQQLEGVWRRSNQVYTTVLNGNSIQIENVAFYNKCRLVGTSGSVFKGNIEGNQIRGVYRKTIRGKTYERPFTGEIAAQGKQIVLEYNELIYLNPVGGTPGQIVDFPTVDKLRKN